MPYSLRPAAAIRENRMALSAMLPVCDACNVNRPKNCEQAWPLKEIRPHKMFHVKHFSAQYSMQTHRGVSCGQKSQSSLAKRQSVLSISLRNLAR